MTERDFSQRQLVTFDGHTPRVADSAWLAPSATLIGRVTVDERASVWFTSVARADAETIGIGAGSNVQDGCVLHADPGFPTRLGAGVSVGHRAVVHGTVVEDDALVGMGAVLLNGCRVGRGALVAAGAVLLEGTQVPPGSLVAGVPGKVRRELTEEEAAGLRATAEHYRRLAERYRALGPGNEGEPPS
ncbi:gamma carbonic anhydrase family protein [Streptomyces sp. 3MP-14]|uniref:Gamma carbonic anhydrase family protein n=1 Tax=Streptomyces mimosae TaxID=2586635 RepID=A0A5N6AB35_9ACTN|nr:MULTISPECIES: gamma carbonic anhydrase family protein [Streptomyces]KAB8165243.1 gamma carbonic anhydrase family protein [Streptomyces mimosae]KAB8175875.1 gamma carbonic anhydrase family protein [Streptomyces sp. 3MP-14]